MIALRDDPLCHGQATSALTSRAAAEVYVASVCFKHGPPRLLGIELEWTVHHSDDRSRRLDISQLADALGPHAPRTLCPDSPHRPLPCGGILTLEPGGQVEISSPPRPGLSAAISDLSADIATLSALLDDFGLILGPYGADPYRAPRRILRTPRYSAMEAAFAPKGGNGLRMMCSTAGIQVCLDAGERSDFPARWAALHAIGPVLSALFANSPAIGGARTRWVSARQRTIFRVDPIRMRPGATNDDPAGSWARRALDTPVICVRKPGGCWEPPHQMTFADWIDGALPDSPSVDDLDYHLSTLFPPVRPRGYLEVRYLDTQPGQYWIEPVALLSALFAKQSTVDKLLEFGHPVRNRWLHAARYGLADRRIAAAAKAIVELGQQALRNTDLSAAQRDTVSAELDRRLAAAKER